MKFNRQVIISIFVLVCLAILVHLPIGGKKVPLSKSFEDFPKVIGRWEYREDSRNDEEIPGIEGADDYIARKYGNSEGYEIRLYTGYLGKQTEGREAIIGIRHYLGEPFEGWPTVDQGIDLLEIPSYSEDNIKINKCIIQNGPRKQLIFYWYQIGGEFIANKYWAKISLVFNAIFRNRRDGAFICLFAPVRHSVDASQENLMDFAELAVPMLADYLPD
jgi:EpsI family protein